jgi:DNA repair exonuclease SbcCD ATPase subunit
MNVLVRGKMQMIKEVLKDVEHKMELTKNRVEDKQKLIHVLEKKSKDSSDKYKTEIDTARETVTELEDEISKLNASVSSLAATIPDHNQIPEDLIKQEGHCRQLEKAANAIDVEISFYDENDSCPTCDQSIPNSFKKEVIIRKNTDKEDVLDGIEELHANIQITNVRLNEINKTLHKISATERKISEKNSDVNASLQYINKMQLNIENLNEESNDTETPKNELNQLIGEGKQFVEQKKEFITDRHYYNIASSLLKDTGIKAKIIRHYLPIMNRLINKYLSEMDFFCQFQLDENFDETIKSRHRDEFTYHSFSEGERLRIDLSLLLAWREVARMKNSVNCNLLILDEVFDSSLDGVGTEEFLKLLATFGKKANIFVISHKSDTMTDKFQNHIIFEKKNNFSRIK